MSTSPAPTTFDPYGEPVDAVRCDATTAGDRRARRIAIAVFWSLALLLTAGRVYTAHPEAAPTLASAPAPVIR
jgi:hypothetical protein